MTFPRLFSLQAPQSITFGLFCRLTKRSFSGTTNPSWTYPTAGKVLPIGKNQEANMNPQSQRTIGWLVVIVAIVALATPRLRSQGTSNDPSARFQKTFSITPGGTLEVDN